MTTSTQVTQPIRITPGIEYPLHDTAATRTIEHVLAEHLAPHVLMRRAGRSVARLAMALAPHAQQIWIAGGPGNNGGDGLEAAAFLCSRGIEVSVTLFGPAHTVCSADALAALQRARMAGVRFVMAAPADLTPHDLCIDAVLGIGQRRQEDSGNATRPPADWLCLAMRALAASPAPVLAIDVPTGLDADTGVSDSQLIAACALPENASATFHCKFTLSLLTLKRGLFTAQGRDVAGSVWFDDLRASEDLPLSAATHESSPRGAAATSGEDQTSPVAYLNPAPPRRSRPAASHKGMFGDVAVVGGEGIGHRGMGMSGAAVMAATAAASSGAGRVLLALLDEDIAGNAVAPPPEIMLRRFDVLDLNRITVVCGCGGGEAVAAILPQVLEQASALVLDADALNAIARSPDLQQLLTARQQRGSATILTPHPLEAARLLGYDNAHRVQTDRLSAVRALIERYAAVVVLKGSGSIIGAPDRLPVINLTGNSRLATAGTGDVLAGMTGAALAAQPDNPFAAAASAVYRHGACADRWPADEPLTAGELARRV
jgi:hydroxyethylthiazole kinase-like uncharacterized protein yjeF